MEFYNNGKKRLFSYWVEGIYDQHLFCLSSEIAPCNPSHLDPVSKFYQTTDLKPFNFLPDLYTGDTNQFVSL